MTSKEKAIQLVDTFMSLSEEQEYNTPRYMSKQMAKRCALITAEEIIQPHNPISQWYWQEVKKEIECL